MHIDHTVGEVSITAHPPKALPPPLRRRPARPGFAAYGFLIAALCAVGPVLAGGDSDHLTGGNLMLAMALAAAAVCAGFSLRRRTA